METKKRLIRAERKQKMALMKIFGVSEVTINRSLRYASNDRLQNMKIRRAAMEMGATYYESKKPTTEDLEGLE